jgi:hypothetical protein
MLFLAVVFAAVVFAIAFLPSGVASADSQHGYIYASPTDLENSETPKISTIAVYDNNSSALMFYLPESYYLSVTGAFLGQYYFVEYMGFEGYVNQADVANSVIAAGAMPADDALEPRADFRLIPSAPLTLEGQEVTADWRIRLLGYKDAETLFVNAQYNSENIYATAPVSAFNPFLLPYNTTAGNQRASILAQREAERAQAEQDKADDLKDGKTGDALRILLIVGIAVPAVIIIFLLFRPSKNARSYDKVSKKTVKAGRADYDRPKSYDSRGGYDRRADYGDREGYDRRDYGGHGDYDRRDRYAAPRYERDRYERPYDRAERDRYYEERDRYYDDRDR